MATVMQRKKLPSCSLIIVWGDITVQFIDLAAQYKALKAEIDRNLQTLLNHGQYIMGPEIEELEQQLAEYVGIKHCISCANGTDALQMLYMAYGIGAGDAVFCPDMTFISSVEPACMLGATPVFCDIEPGTYNLSPQSLERQIKCVLAEGKLTPKLVVAVDILGNPADFDELLPICQKYDIILVEDAAQSTGASYHGKMCGSFGHSAITSFFPAKPLGCYGDGGAIFTNDDVLAEHCRSLRVHGKGKLGKYHNERIGMNSRLDTLQAAILIPKLKALQGHEVEARQRIAQRYNEAFAEHFTIPFVAPNTISIYAQYALLAKDAAQRDCIMEKLTRASIPNMIYYPAPQHRLPVFSEAPHYAETFTNANDYCARTFSLPMHPYLTEDEQQAVIGAVLEAVGIG